MGPIRFRQRPSKKTRSSGTFFITTLVTWLSPFLTPLKPEVKGRRVAQGGARHAITQNQIWSGASSIIRNGLGPRPATRTTASAERPRVVAVLDDGGEGDGGGGAKATVARQIRELPELRRAESTRAS